MRIGVVHYGIYPWNRGIDQLCALLLRVGHEPIVLADRPRSGAISETVNGVPVVHVGRRATARSRTSPADLRWGKWILSFARTEMVEALIVRESILSPWLLSAARRLGIPAYVDMRENLPAMYTVGRARGWRAKLLKQPAIIRWLERRYLPRYEHIFAVSPELRAWLLSSYRLDAARVSVLENTPGAQFLEQAAGALRAEQRDERRILVFAGHIRENRGIQDIIRALPAVLTQVPDARLRIIGEGDYLPVLRSLVTDLEVEHAVEFQPMLPADGVAAALAACTVGLAPYHLSEQTHDTVPGKLFEYMAVGLPVYASPRVPVKRIIEQTQCGLICESQDPAAIAAVLVRLLTDRDEAERLGANGRKAVQERFNWKHNVKIVEAVIGRPDE